LEGKQEPYVRTDPPFGRLLEVRADFVTPPIVSISYRDVVCPRVAW